MPKRASEASSPKASKKAKDSDVVEVVGTQYWLMKSEPDVYGIDNLQKEVQGHWDGVRNYQARNYIRKMRDGDVCFLYHSSCKAPGIYGMMKIVGESLPDKLALDRTSKYFDPKATLEVNPWSSIVVEFVKAYEKPLLLPEIRELKDLGQCPLTTRGSRLSIMPLSASQFELFEKTLSSVN